jgi:hypothetical protein
MDRVSPSTFFPGVRHCFSRYQLLNPSLWECKLEDPYEFIESYECLTGKSHPYTEHRSQERQNILNSFFREEFRKAVDPVLEVDRCFSKVYRVALPGSAALGTYLLCFKVLSTGFVLKIGGLSNGLIGIVHLSSRYGATSLWNSYLYKKVAIDSERLDGEEFMKRLAAIADQLSAPDPKIIDHLRTLENEQWQLARANQTFGMAFPDYESYASVLYGPVRGENIPDSWWPQKYDTLAKTFGDGVEHGRDPTR